MLRLTALLALSLVTILACSCGGPSGPSSTQESPRSSAPTLPPPVAVPGPGPAPAPASTAPRRAQALLIDFSEDEFSIPKAAVTLLAHAGVGTVEKSGLPHAKCEDLIARYALDGPFTSTEAKQRLYVLEGRFCGNWVETVHFVLDSPDGEVALGGTIGDSVVLVEDLNGDGLEELMVAGTGMHQGYLTTSADIGTFAGGKWTQLRDLGRVYEDNCGTIKDDRKERVRVFFQTHRDLTTLTAKEYQQPCGSGKQWKFARDVKLGE